MTPTFVIVPVRNEWHLTEAFLISLRRQHLDDVLIIDNGSTDHTASRVRSLRDWTDVWRGCLHYTYQPDRSIYELWNHGFARAKRLAKRRPFRVLVTNNDIELPPLSLAFLNDALTDDPDAMVAYPDQDAPWDPVHYRLGEPRMTRGVFGDGGLFGACFMLAGDRIPWSPLITDPAYWWWYGDNHLAECIELAGGKQVRVVGLPVKHVNEGTARHYPELWAKKLHDRGSWVTRHQRGYGVAP